MLQRCNIDATSWGGRRARERTGGARSPSCCGRCGARSGRAAAHGAGARRAVRVRRADRLPQPAGAVVLAETREEVIETVRACHRSGVPFVARGSGTSLSGGSLPIEGGIVIALNRLNRILRLDPDAAHRGGRAGRDQPRCHAGRRAARAVLRARPVEPVDLHHRRQRRLQLRRRALPEIRHDQQPRARPQGGAARRRGRASSAATAASASGRTGPGCSSAREGLFGIALEITLRLLPRPEAMHTVLAAYRHPEAAGDAVARVVATGLLPGAMEIMDALAIEAAEAAVHAGLSAGRRGAADRRARRRARAGRRRRRAARAR